MSKVVVAAGQLGMHVAVSLIARGNAAVLVGTPATSVDDLRRSFGLASLPWPGDDRGAWDAALHDADAMVLGTMDVGEEGWPVMTRAAGTAALQAAGVSGVRRAVLLSTPASASVFADLPADLASTLLRFGTVTDRIGSNRVAVADSLPLGEIPVPDAAAVAVAVLETGDAVGRAWDVAAGDSGPRKAIRAALG